MTTISPVIVFWSWQADADATTNRNFVQDCLERAAKQLRRSGLAIVEVDRDTQGIGGSPEIARAIFRKIRSADIFVWDGTLVYSNPRAAPNPNVMIELGYAHAVLGDGRLIGVMNVANGRGPDGLPFDLRSRRWPITYSLDAPSSAATEAERREFLSRRSEVREELTGNLAKAISAALKEPRHGAIHSDVNMDAARQLWALIDSEWLHGWYSFRSEVPQFEESENLRIFTRYPSDSLRPENQFEDERLRTTHTTFVSALEHYAGVAATEMVPSNEVR